LRKGSGLAQPEPKVSVIEPIAQIRLVSVTVSEN
jgi:hypothetical protein